MATDYAALLGQAKTEAEAMTTYNAEMADVTMNANAKFALYQLFMSLSGKLAGR